MAISTNYDELIKTFHIFGVLKDNTTGIYNNVPFDKGMNFEGFLIKRRQDEEVK